jgi:hypothetical protein
LYDQLQRMNAALAPLRAWIEARRAEHASDRVTVASLGFGRLPHYFSPTLLNDVSVVPVTKVPFPPLADFELTELTEMTDMVRLGLAAITFDDTIYVHQSLGTESIHFHELVHAAQWRALGIERLLLTYGSGLLTHGYARNPLEAMAYDLQSQFDRNVPILNLEATVAAHARALCGETAALFERHQVPMGSRP